ncbi:hypothetical protein PR048_000441 [Dryococelus australis]|uniref:DUF4817 domain-containing protein n=1 Tax=Dryococelus australis TaxID=614101 RepID=A0ABQ9IFI4_9NEOP|nr:hypothetical protein PR048_000441 [Dryococelus australis]
MQDVHPGSVLMPQSTVEELTHYHEKFRIVLFCFVLKSNIYIKVNTTPVAAVHACLRGLTYDAVRADFTRRFRKPGPANVTIRHIINKFNRTGSVKCYTQWIVEHQSYDLDADSMHEGFACVLLSPVSLPRFLTLDDHLHGPLNTPCAIEIVDEMSNGHICGERFPNSSCDVSRSHSIVRKSSQTNTGHPISSLQWSAPVFPGPYLCFQYCSLLPGNDHERLSAASKSFGIRRPPCDMHKASPLKEAPWEMCVTERGNEEIQSSVTTKIPRTTPKVVKGTGEDVRDGIDTGPPLKDFTLQFYENDAAGRRVFSRISHFSHPCIPALLHTHLTSPSSALKTSMVDGGCRSYEFNFPLDMSSVSYLLSQPCTPAQRGTATHALLEEGGEGRGNPYRRRPPARSSASPQMAAGPQHPMERPCGSRSITGGACGIAKCGRPCHTPPRLSIPTTLQNYCWCRRTYFVNSEAHPKLVNVRMEQRRNEVAGLVKGDTLENPLTSGIVRHDSHMRKSRVSRLGIEPCSPWWEASSLNAQPPWPQLARVLFFFVKSGQKKILIAAKLTQQFRCLQLDACTRHLADQLAKCRPWRNICATTKRGGAVVIREDPGECWDGSLTEAVADSCPIRPQSIFPMQLAPSIMTSLSTRHLRDNGIRYSSTRTPLLQKKAFSGRRRGETKITARIIGSGGSGRNQLRRSVSWVAVYEASHLRVCFGHKQKPVRHLPIRRTCDFFWYPERKQQPPLLARQLKGRNKSGVFGFVVHSHVTSEQQKEGNAVKSGMHPCGNRVSKVKKRGSDTGDTNTHAYNIESHEHTLFKTADFKQNGMFLVLRSNITCCICALGYVAFLGRSPIHVLTTPCHAYPWRSEDRHFTIAVWPSALLFSYVPGGHTGGHTTSRGIPKNLGLSVLGTRPFVLRGYVNVDALGRLDVPGTSSLDHTGFYGTGLLLRCSFLPMLCIKSGVLLATVFVDYPRLPPDRLVLERLRIETTLIKVGLVSVAAEFVSKTHTAYNKSLVASGDYHKPERLASASAQERERESDAALRLLNGKAASPLAVPLILVARPRPLKVMAALLLLAGPGLRRDLSSDSSSRLSNMTRPREDVRERETYGYRSVAVLKRELLRMRQDTRTRTSIFQPTGYFLARGSSRQREQLGSQFLAASRAEQLCLCTVLSDEIWAALDIEVFRADEGELRCDYRAVPEWGKREIPEKNHRPAASSGTNPTWEIPE